MSNLFQRQLSQGDQVNLQSPLALASLNIQQTLQKPHISGFSPSHRMLNQNQFNQAQINQLTSLTNASSESSLADSTSAQQTNGIQGLSPYINNQYAAFQNYGQQANKENSSPIFLREQPFSVNSSKNENKFINNDFINPTKLFTQEFINQNKLNQQPSTKIPLQVQQFSPNLQTPLQPQQNYKNDPQFARNEYFNSLKAPPILQYQQQQQQQQPQQYNPFSKEHSKQNMHDSSFNQSQLDQSNLNYDSYHNYSCIPSSSSIPYSQPALSNNNSNIYQNQAEKQTSLSNINFKIEQNERPLSLLLENAIQKAINQSEKVISNPVEPVAQQINYYSQRNIYQQQQISNPNILVEDFSNQTLPLAQNYYSVNDNLTPRNASNIDNYQSLKHSNNSNSISSRNNNNQNQNNSQFIEIQENKPSPSPINKRQQQNLNNSTYSTSNSANRPSQRDQQPRLTLVERQTLNTSHSPSKSHINCKYPHNTEESNRQQSSSKKKMQNYSQVPKNQIMQQPSLMRSKSNNSLVAQHPYLKKQTRNNGSPSDKSYQANQSYQTTHAQAKKLDKNDPQKFTYKKEAQNRSQHQAKLNNSSIQNRRETSPNNTKQQTPNKQQQPKQALRQKTPNQSQLNQNQSNQFIFHQQNISQLNPSPDMLEQQYSYQQTSNLHATPRSQSQTSLLQSQNNNSTYINNCTPQMVLNQNPYLAQSPISNFKQAATPKTPLSTNFCQALQQIKSSNLPSDYLQMEQIITNYDVQRFLQRHFLVGDKLICENWNSIPIIYFIKLLITEFPEVLEDHQIGENLLTELKEKIAFLVQDEQNNEFVNLFKLQTYTKTTGLLGLILKALKDLSSEENSRLYTGNFQSLMRTNSDIQLVQLQNQQENASIYSHQAHNSVCSQNQAFLENFQTVFQKSLQSNGIQHYIQSKDVQNIMNLIQEFVEGLYRDMENEIYSKFNVEMRRMMVKFKETEQMLRVVSDKVTDNYGLFSQEASQVKKIKQLQGEKAELNEQVNSKDLEIKQLQLLVDSLKTENAKLLCENDKLHEKCEKYLDFGMKNMQTLYENNLQDQYQQLVQQQKVFFEQQIKQLEDYKIRQSIQKNAKNNEQTKDQQNNLKQTPRIHTDTSDNESCNLSYALMTLEDQAVPQGGFQSSSKVPQSAIKALNEFQVHQNQNAFKKNKTEGQVLEPIMMDNAQFLDTSDKISLLKVLDVFISQSQIKDFSEKIRRQNLSYGQGISGFGGNSNFGSFVINAATITGKYGFGRDNQQLSSLSLDQAVEKLQSMIDILPLIREVRLFNYDQIYNFLKYFYSLQMYIYQLSDYSEQQTTPDDTTSRNVHITSIPMNKCWKKILSESNNKEFFCSFVEGNNNTQQTSPNTNNNLSTPIRSQRQNLQKTASSSNLTPTSKPDIFELQKICHDQKQSQIQQQNKSRIDLQTSFTNNNTQYNESRFHPKNLIINNQGIIDILTYVLTQHLHKIASYERQYQSADCKSKYFILKMLIYLNILIISNNKNDILTILNKFFQEIQSQIQVQSVSDFIRENNVLSVIFVSLRNINFANTQIVSQALEFLISFKQASSNYMSFIRQLSQDQNMVILLQLLECQFDSRNILMALNIIKNVSYSINFKDNIQSRIKQVLDQIQLRQNETKDKEIEDLIKVIKSNINCGANIRTISLSPQQINGNSGIMTKNN
ncbi:hypothetical protein ABPG74_014516 [Tetrahymena malaccensis]